MSKRETIEHFESIFGKISGGHIDESIDSFVDVVFIEDKDSQVLLCATNGLSEHILRLPENKTVRIELIAQIKGNASDRKHLRKMLAYLANSILKDHLAPLRGEVASLPKEYFEKSKIRNVYFTDAQSVYPAQLGNLKLNGESVVYVWVLPITETELEMIKNKGWTVFEDYLEISQIDLFNLYR